MAILEDFDYGNVKFNTKVDADGVHTLQVALTDGNGNPINSFEGALNVHDSHSHHRVINERFHQDTATTTTFASNVSAGATQITLTSATGFAVGDFLHLENGMAENPNPSITVLVGTLATLDRPLDNSFSAGDTITKTIHNMAVNGTLASPQSFKVQPIVGEVWHLMRMLIEMTHSTAGDNGLFGNLTALTNGVTFRRYDGATGTYRTFTNWKTNGDMVTDMYDIFYSVRSGGGGSYGTNGRATFYNSGAVIRLDGTAGDFLEILVQDNLSTMDSYRIKAQGHIEGV